MARSPILNGTVVDFDDDVGLGVIEGDDGVELRFHCTSIADGSRHVETGAKVTYTVAAGRIGGWEADGVLAAAR